MRTLTDLDVLIVSDGVPGDDGSVWNGVTCMLLYILPHGLRVTKELNFPHKL